MNSNHNGDNTSLGLLPITNTLIFRSSASLPIAEFGKFIIHVFTDSSDGKEHIALTSKLPFTGSENSSPIVRIHSSCVTGDIFGSLRCDCGKQLEFALKNIGMLGGVLIYLSQEGRGIGLAAKIKAYALQEQGLSTSEANIQLGFAPDQRQYHTAAEILKYFKLKKVRLISNNPLKVTAL